LHFAEKLDRFISNAGNPFSRSEAKKFKPEVNALGFLFAVRRTQNPLPGTLRPESRHCLTLIFPPVAGFFISGSGNHPRHAFLLNRPEGLTPFKHTAPAFKPEVRDYENA
jgi:hypothetical protein